MQCPSLWSLWTVNLRDQQTYFEARMDVSVAYNTIVPAKTCVLKYSGISSIMGHECGRLLPCEYLRERWVIKSLYIQYRML